MNLRQLEERGVLKLPGPSSWGGSFHGMDELFTGDEKSLTFVHSSGGSSESDDQNIILKAQLNNNYVTARIRGVKQRSSKKLLINHLNQYAGKSVSEIYNIDLGIISPL